jgi:CspA family cold shock protein
LNARQKRLFEDARKKNPSLKVPEPQPVSNWSEDDLALIKQGVGDKSGRPASAMGGEAQAGGDSETPSAETGAVVTYFEEKGFGFLRPDNGGRDVFFHISRLNEGEASDLVPGARVIYELGMDRTGKMAASSVRVVPPAATTT